MAKQLQPATIDETISEIRVLRERGYVPGSDPSDRVMPVQRRLRERGLSANASRVERAWDKEVSHFPVWRGVHASQHAEGESK